MTGQHGRNSPIPTIRAMTADARAMVAAEIFNALLLRWKSHVLPPQALELYLDVLARLDVAAEADEDEAPPLINWDR